MQTLDEWLRYLEELHPDEIDLGLDRVRVVAERAGLLDRLPPIVTVGGTNGKGSVVEYLMRCYDAAGLRTGAYTSPHLHRFNERIRVNTEEVADSELVAAFTRLESLRGDVSLTYFEFATLAAMQVFVEQDLDIIILEVGLGGRLDAVNLWSASLAVITSVGIDHEAWLGSDREVIATEKVAIARPGQPLVVGERERPDSIQHYADLNSVPIYRIGEEFETELVTNNTSGEGERGLHIRLPQGQSMDLPLPELKGPHQLGNTAVAVCAIHLLSGCTDLPRLSAETIAAGLGAASLQGRMQQVNVGKARVILDVAHNPAAALVLREALLEYIGGEAGAGTEPGCVAVFAMMRDKDIDAVVEALGPLVKSWYCAGLQVARALPPQDAAALIKVHYPRVNVREFEDVPAALEAALEHVVVTPGEELHSNDSNAPPYIVVFGSFFTVADALAYLDQTGTS